MDNPFRSMPGAPSEFGPIGRRLDVHVDFSFTIEGGLFYGADQSNVHRYTDSSFREFRKSDVYSGYYLFETMEFLVLGRFPDGQTIERIEYVEKKNRKHILPQPLKHSQLYLRKSHINSVATHAQDREIPSSHFVMDYALDTLKGATIDILVSHPTSIGVMGEIQGQQRFCSDDSRGTSVYSGVLIDTNSRNIVLGSPSERSVDGNSGAQEYHASFYQSCSMNLRHVLGMGILE